MRRREFIMLLGAGAVWPVFVLAQQQQSGIPIIGVITTTNEASASSAALEQGLRQTGYIVGQNILLSYYSVEEQYNRFSTLAADLVQHQVSAIVIQGSTAGAIAAKQATATVPIVFVIGANPVEFGIVDSLRRPGGNLTGLSLLNAELDPKRLGLLAELVPDALLVGFLVNPDSPTTKEKIDQIKTAADALQRRIEVFYAKTDGDLDNAFAIMAERHIRGLIIAADSFLNLKSEKIAALSVRYEVPVIGATREVAVKGGLMSYGPSRSDAFREAGIYVGRILKGEKPAEMPVLQPTRFEFVINLQAAKKLRVMVPPGVLAIADEVIE